MNAPWCSMFSLRMRIIRTRMILMMIRIDLRTCSSNIIRLLQTFLSSPWRARHEAVRDVVAWIWLKSAWGVLPTLNVSRHAWGYLHPHGQALFLGLHKRSLSFKDKVSSELVASLLTRSCSWRSRISDCTCGYGHGCSWSKGFKHWHFQLLGIMFGE